MRIERRVLFTLWVGCVVAVTAAPLAGSVRTVCASGCEFASLQEAVDSSEWGATIQLGPGVYVENVVLRGALTIRGAGAERTVIDGGSWDAVLRLEGPLAYRVRIEDLTIQSGARTSISAAPGEVALERCVLREAGSDRPLLGGRGVTGQTDPPRVGAARRSGRGVRSTAPSVSSTGEQSTDAVPGDPSTDGLSDLASASGGSGGVFTLCHIPPGNPENAQTIAVGAAAVATHLAHGDSLGPCPVDPRFTANGDGTVTDNLTGLIWLQEASCLGTRNWTGALSEANNLADGSCGLSDSSVSGDWHLPNIRELQSLIDYGQYEPALPLGHPFSVVQSDGHWSSNSYAVTASRAWYVDLTLGHLHDGNRAGTFYVWPVRGGQ